MDAARIRWDQYSRVPTWHSMSICSSLSRPVRLVRTCNPLFDYQRSSRQLQMLNSALTYFGCSTILLAVNQRPTPRLTWEDGASDRYSGLTLPTRKEEFVCLSFRVELRWRWF